MVDSLSRSYCQKGMKSYFLKASELNDRFSEAPKYGKESSAMNWLTKPSCLIINEVGRCIFNKPCTELFFDMIDRRYNKEGPTMIIFTSNFTLRRWKDYFIEDSALLCSLDRIFDSVAVFMMKGQNYRGRKLETLVIETGITIEKKYDSHKNCPLVHWLFLSNWNWSNISDSEWLN